MLTPGFVALAATTCRASAAKLSVESVAERVAHLSWSGPTRAVVYYAPQGAKFRSRRLVVHPRIALRNLHPGIPYDVHVVADNFDARTTFTTTATAASEVDQELPLTELSRLEIRVGKILECERHPDADTLYVEKVDVGEEVPRTIVSGLVKFVPLDKMVGRHVIVLCNLKPRAMRGVTSQDVPVGQLVTFAGHRVAPIDPSNRATKAFDRISDDLKTNHDGVALYKDVPFATSGGPCVSPDKLVGSVS